MKKNLILSTCGISTLLNNAEDNTIKTLLNKYTNVMKPDDIGKVDREKIENHINNVQKRFPATSIENAIKESSELNGILSFYGSGGLSSRKGDLHYLLSTDTWLCSEAAEIIKQWLEKNSMTVQVQHHAGLQTADRNLFNSSLSDLVMWCHETIKPNRSSYNVVFNLSAGFKSETGFLQVLGMFYAHETVYIFERSNDLMRIPHLPITMNGKEDIKNDLHAFRRASNDLEVRETKDGIYWETLEGQSIISPWGMIVFEEHQKELYQEKLLDSISTRIVFAETFKKSCENETPEHLEEVNGTIDQLAKMQENDSKHNLPSLNFKVLKGKPVRGSTHECDAWHDGAAKRIFCRIDGEAIILDRLDNALH